MGGDTFDGLFLFLFLCGVVTGAVGAGLTILLVRLLSEHLSLVWS